jgi:hypothetical protein
MAVPEGWRSHPGYGGEIATLRVGRFAAGQQARIAQHQLNALGIGRSTIDRWLAGGFLHRRLPGIFIVGSPARTVESDLWEAVLYAGPGAMLSHATAAKWLGMVDRWPDVIHVSTARRRRSLPGICVHPRRTGLIRTTHAAIPVTSIADTLLDLSAAGELALVRRSPGSFTSGGCTRQACGRRAVAGGPAASPCAPNLTATTR